MTIATELQSEFESAFLDDDFFAESITYNANGSSSTINAVIYRPGQSAYSQRYDRGADSKPVQYDVEIRVSRSDVPTVIERVDYVTLPVVYGGATANLRVAKIIHQDPGTWKLGLTI